MVENVNVRYRIYKGGMRYKKNLKAVTEGGEVNTEGEGERRENNINGCYLKVKKIILFLFTHIHL